MSFRDARLGRGLVSVETLHTARISPNFVRVTLGGDLSAFPDHGFDQWFRLFLPRGEGTTSFALPDRMNMVGYLQYLALGPAKPHMRNYTVRSRRIDELDVDFVVHGDEGVAGRWCTRTLRGDRVALIDQGRGFEPRPEADATLLVADETGLPAVLGILRDLRRDTRGTAFIEITDPDDAQDTDAPTGVDVHWVVRPADALYGDTVMAAVRERIVRGSGLAAYLVGEQRIPTTLRRWLVEGGVPKSAIDFVGYWKRGGAYLGGRLAA